MAKGGKFTSLMKKLSFGMKSSRSSSSLRSDMSLSSSSSSMEATLVAVYVGKSRRRYLLTSDVVAHPLFQQLAGKSSSSASSGGGDGGFTVGCEVVLFEHLLWMLDNADPQPESLEELVEFYAC